MAEEPIDSYIAPLHIPQSPCMPNELVENSPDGKYSRYNDKIGAGAQKTVWKAIQHNTGRQVAWCVITTIGLGKEQKEKISKEVLLMKKLQHPNLIKFISAWNNKDKQEFVFITELMTGGSLKDYIFKIGQPRLRVIKQWCKDILEGLNYLHSQQPYPIVHRDLKTDNIFVCSNTGTLKIGDFGLSKHLTDQKYNTLVGTPKYIAPETFQEEYGTRVDIYAFGLVLLEMSTCRSVYEECSSVAQVYHRIVNGIKPKIFYKLLDTQVQELIALCIGPKEERPSAQELLQHQFWAIDEQDERNNRAVLVNEEPVSPISGYIAPNNVQGEYIKPRFGEVAQNFIQDSPEDKQQIEQSEQEGPKINLNQIQQKPEVSSPKTYSTNENTPQSAVINPQKPQSPHKRRQSCQEEAKNRNLSILTNEKPQQEPYTIDFSLSIRHGKQQRKVAIKIPITADFNEPQKIGEYLLKELDIDKQWLDHIVEIVSQKINRHLNGVDSRNSTVILTEEVSNNRSYENQQFQDTSPFSSGNISPIEPFNDGDVIMERGPNNDRDQVKMLHSALCSALHLKRIAEDFYGKKTQQYVKQFQQQHRLYVDGKVDRRVWQLLSKYNTSHQHKAQLDYQYTVQMKDIKKQRAKPYAVAEDIYMVPCEISATEYVPLCVPSECNLKELQNHSKQAWLPAEDDFLKDYITKKGVNAWTSVARELNLTIHQGLPVRQGKQCRERWHNHLNPNLQKGNWTKNEDRYIFQMQQTIGNKWSKIAKRLPGRTENQVKNRFNSMIRKASKRFPPNVDVASMLLSELGGYEMEYLSPQAFKVFSPMLARPSKKSDMGFTIYAEYANSQTKDVRNDSFSPSLFLNQM